MNIKRTGLLQVLTEEPYNEVDLKVSSNFGETKIIGVAECGSDVLHATKNYLHNFKPEEWHGQTTQIVRVEMKMCDRGPRLIEVEQRPAGIGIFLAAFEDLSLSPRPFFGTNLARCAIFYSPGRTKRGRPFSDEHLFSKRLFMWNRREQEIRGAIKRSESIIVRSREDEEMPDSLLRTFLQEEAIEKFLLLRRNGDKRKVAEDLDLPHQTLSPLDKTSLLVKHRLSEITAMWPEGVVVKPRRGSRSREVRKVPRKIKGSSRVVRALRKNPEAYIFEPYHQGVGEIEHRIVHLFRLFFIRTRNGSGWQYVGGFLMLGDMASGRSGQLITGSDQMSHILLTGPR